MKLVQLWICQLCFRMNLFLMASLSIGFYCCESNYNGVTWYKMSNKWVARVWHDKKRFSVGYFESELDAAKAVNFKWYSLS